MHWQVGKKITHTHIQTELKCIPTIREKGSLAALTPNQVMHTYTLTQVLYINVSKQLHNMLTLQGRALTVRHLKTRQCVRG